MIYPIKYSNIGLAKVPKRKTEARARLARQQFGELAGLSISQLNDDGGELTFDAGEKDHLAPTLYSRIGVHLLDLGKSVHPIIVDLDRHGYSLIAWVDVPDR